MSSPIICFGQQPSGFFPKRFLVSKIRTAKRIQAEIGGEIVFFFHDADHDYRETITKLADRRAARIDSLNFDFANKIQKRYSPLYTKKIAAGWQANTARQLPKYVSRELVDIFSSITADTVADFCLEMYRAMGLLSEIRIERSSDPELRASAIGIEDCFVDTEYRGEVVRARKQENGFSLHKGGDAYIDLPFQPYGKTQISPTRDTRLRWMQSALACTHYVAGASEIKYMRKEDAPEIEYIERDPIDRLDEAYVGE